MSRYRIDVVRSLRSALDQAVYGSTKSLTGKALNNTKFPFGDEVEGARNDAKGRGRDVPSEMVEYLLTFEPHKDGNPLLWGLNKLRNTKSHRILVPVASDVSLVGSSESAPGVMASPPGWDPATGTLKALMNPPKEGQLNAVMAVLHLEPVIGTGAFRGEPAAGLFRRLLGEVDRVVAGIEAETARLLRKRNS